MAAFSVRCRKFAGMGRRRWEATSPTRVSHCATKHLGSLASSILEKRLLRVFDRNGAEVHAVQMVSVRFCTAGSDSRLVEKG